MRIAVLGMDNSGKTTLISRLMEQLEGDWEQTKSKSGGLGATKMEMVDWMMEVLQFDGNVITDRFAWFDDQVYAPVLNRDVPFGLNDIYQSHINKGLDMIIYCRPPRYEIEDWQDREQMEGVEEQSEALLNTYDDLIFKLQGIVSFKVPIMIYDYTEDNGTILKCIIEELEEKSTMEEALRELGIWGE